MSSLAQESPFNVSSQSPIGERWRGFFQSPVDWVLVSGLVGLAPLLYSEAKSLWYLKHYQFFPMAWAAFVAILLLRGQLANSVSRGRKIIGTAGLTFTVGISVLAVLLYYPKVAHIAVIGLLMGWMLLRLKNPWYECVAWTALLLVTVRLPVTLDQNLIHGLQTRSSQSASALLDLTSIPHLATGNVIEIKPGKLFVEEACSGVDSFYALMAVAIMLCVWQRRGLLVSLLTLAAVPLWAWFGNVVRLYILTLLYNNFDINLTEGWQHTVLGLVIFSLAFGGLLSMMEALNRLFGPLPGGETNTDWAHWLYNVVVSWPDSFADDAAPASSAGTSANLTSGASSNNAAARPGGLGLALPVLGVVAFLICGAVSAAPLVGLGKNQATRSPGFDRGEVAATFAEDNLPADFEGMVRKAFEVSHRERNSMFGAHSATWTFQDKGRDIVLSLDFAFTVFHPLEVCYISTGSKVVGEIEQFEYQTDLGTQFASSVQLLDLFGEQSHLIYTEFTDEGISAERMDNLSLTAFFNKGIFEKSLGPLFQLQILIPDASSLSDAEKDRYRDILIKAREKLLPKIKQLTSPGSAPVALPQDSVPADSAPESTAPVDAANS
ncbi:MAG: exosortase U [Pirellulaceae bacterium]|nr:exosortase U [Pirellulaceae bacterium]